MSLEGCYCGANANSDDFCRKHIIRLEEEWKAQQGLSGKEPCECDWDVVCNPTVPGKCPECDGVIREKPYLLVKQDLEKSTENQDDQRYGQMYFSCHLCDELQKGV